MKDIIDRKLYDTETAALVASDEYWDGHNWQRQGRNQFLYRTPKGNFFLAKTTLWQRERDSIIALSREEAMEYYESLPERKMDYQGAFGVEPQEA